MTLPLLAEGLASAQALSPQGLASAQALSAELSATESAVALSAMGPASTGVRLPQASGPESARL